MADAELTRRVRTLEASLAQSQKQITILLAGQKTTLGVAGAALANNSTSTTVNYSNIVGASKPADNATLGAVVGENLYNPDGSIWSPPDIPVAPVYLDDGDMGESMAANKVIRFGPVALGTSAANIINTALGSLSGPVGYAQTQPYVVIKHVRLVNKTASAATVSLYIGATGGSVAGTEFLGTALSIAANSAYDWYGMVRLDAADFLTGFASAVATVTFEAEGEIGLS